MAYLFHWFLGLLVHWLLTEFTIYLFVCCSIVINWFMGYRCSGLLAIGSLVHRPLVYWSIGCWSISMFIIIVFPPVVGSLVYWCSNLLVVGSVRVRGVFTVHIVGSFVLVLYWYYYSIASFVYCIVCLLNHLFICIIGYWHLPVSSSSFTYCIICFLRYWLLALLIHWHFWFMVLSVHWCYHFTGTIGLLYWLLVGTGYW